MGFVYLSWPLAYGLILTSIPSRSCDHIYVAVPDFSIPIATCVVVLPPGKSGLTPWHIAKHDRRLCFVTFRG